MAVPIQNIIMLDSCLTVYKINYISMTVDIQIWKWYIFWNLNDWELPIISWFMSYSLQKCANMWSTFLSLISFFYEFLSWKANQAQKVFGHKVSKIQHRTNSFKYKKNKTHYFYTLYFSLSSCAYIYVVVYINLDRQFFDHFCYFQIF